MKTLKKLILVTTVGSILSCTTQKSDSVAASSCPFPSQGLARVSTYGAFDPSTLDQCEQFNGTTSHWTGMDISASSTALVGIPTSLFNSGAACGSCIRIEGASATVIARVVADCPSCPSDVIDMDQDHFLQATGFSSPAGYGSVTATAIPCPSTENVKVWMNTGTNPFYLNVALANHVTPIKKVEADVGSGYQQMSRSGTSGAFELTGLSSPAPSSAQIRLTDQFDQVITGTFDTAVSSSTVLGSQFGSCN